MAYLIDTNFISETMRPRPDPTVNEWIFSKTQDDLYLRVVTIAELRRGAEEAGRGRRRDALQSWVTLDLPNWFGDHFLSVDLKVADECGRLLATGRKNGWNLEAMDAIIAATAQVHDLTLATLNRKHFEKLGVRLLSL